MLPLCLSNHTAQATHQRVRLEGAFSPLTDDFILMSTSGGEREAPLLGT